MSTDGACRVLLIGMMGSGKSTIGHLLAAETGWPYVDNDELVRRTSGATARQVLADRGEAAMREVESDALAMGISTPAPVIIGVAAGTILDPADRNRLRAGGVVVWLHADAAVLEERASGADHRPWLDTQGESWFRETAAEREPLYAEVADLTIDTGAEPAKTTAAQLSARLRATDACSDALSSNGPPAHEP